jgi:hypothetical protein
VIFFGAIYWIIWIAIVVLSFAILEGLGIFHRGPTLSSVWKRWEDRGPQVKGQIKWTAFRVLTLVGLIALSTYLILHWVAEVIP